MAGSIFFRRRDEERMGPLNHKKMPLPPVPESPNRKQPGNSGGTPRVGMHLYQNDSDDDVSVLTFNTLIARDNSSNYVRTARENLEKMVLESQNVRSDDDCNILTRISEEAASQSSSMRGKSEDNEEEDFSDDDDTITLSESVLASADQVLSSIGSWRGKDDSSSIHDESPVLQPRQKYHSPTRRPVALSDAEYNAEKDDSSSKASGEKDKQLEVSSNFLNSYYDENATPTNKNTNMSRYTIKTNNDVPSPLQRSMNSKSKNEHRLQRLENMRQYKYTVETTNTPKAVSHENEQRLLKLEADTRHLHVLLKERQLETSKANQALMSSIASAKKLLDSIGVGKE
jgi:hypothetical protein